MNRHWFQGIVISLLVLILAGTIGAQLILNAQNADRRREQVCDALPTAAAAGAQALIDIAVGQAIKKGATSAEINHTREVGLLYVKRARELVLRDLTYCTE